MKKTHYHTVIPLDELWEMDRFFYIDDIKRTYKSFNLPIPTIGKKKDLLESLRNHIKTRHNEHTNEFNQKDKVIPIQKAWRTYWIKREWRGPGFLHKKACTNREDFYTLETIEETNDNFFFSYRDPNKIIFFFDIRSFEKLLQDDEILNPYNRQPIPDYALIEYNKRRDFMTKMKLWKTHYDDTSHILTAEQKLNLRVVSVVSELNLLNIIAGGIDANWFTGLSLVKLKKYYASLEDIWMYRASLTKKQKIEIIPNVQKMNKLFPYNVKQVVNSSPHMLDYEKMIYILMDIIETLITSSAQQQHRITAANYVMIALTEVSPQVASAIPWLAQNNY